MVQLLAFYRGKPLDTFLNQFPVREFETDDEYYWDVIGSSRRNIPLIEARDENGTVVTEGSGNVGIGTSPFYLVFPEDWFADGEVIVGNLNQVYPIRILGDARMEGTNAVYKCETMGGLTQGIPAERLLAGERFSIEYAPVEREGSRKVGDIRFSTPVSMRNEWSTIRIHHKVWGNKLGKKLAFGIPMVRNVDGKQVKDTANMWMHYVDWELECQFSEYKNNVMAFGTSNRNANGEYMNFGKSGNVIKTGERGAILFHKAVLQTVSGWTTFVMDNNSTKVVEKTQSKLHSNALSAGFQFVEYKAPNGVRVRLDVDPFYDDPVRNKVLHPMGGVAMSYRFDIWYIGSMDQPNIFKCNIKGDNELRSYQWGLRNPFTGQMGNPHMSYDEDSATIHKMATLGVCVLDPTRTLSLIPAILQG